MLNVKDLDSLSVIMGMIIPACRVMEQEKPKLLMTERSQNTMLIDNDRYMINCSCIKAKPIVILKRSAIDKDFFIGYCGKCKIQHVTTMQQIVDKNRVVENVMASTSI